jgi:hypothetical protein
MHTSWGSAAIQRAANCHSVLVVSLRITYKQIKPKEVLKSVVSVISLISAMISRCGSINASKTFLVVGVGWGE